MLAQKGALGKETRCEEGEHTLGIMRMAFSLVCVVTCQFPFHQLWQWHWCYANNLHYASGALLFLRLQSSWWDTERAWFHLLHLSANTNSTPMWVCLAAKTIEYALATKREPFQSIKGRKCLIIHSIQRNECPKLQVLSPTWPQPFEPYEPVLQRTKQI